MQTLALKDVRYTYKTKHQTVKALNGISCEFVQGVFYAIVGKSGSGKTTMLSVIAGLDEVDGGGIFFEGNDINNMNRDRYRLDNVSVIYQSLNLLPLLTVIENTSFPLEYRGVKASEARKAAAEKLLSVGLDEGKFNRLPAMLSGGEQQRVAIARALVANTKIILADEPTGNLDTENSLNIVRLLKNLAASENVCVVVVTHDPAVAEQADVRIRISDGLLTLV
jgi:putative ABC transport system ATP-binding protein